MSRQIVVEGFHDRAFVSALLVQLGCTSLRGRTGVQGGGRYVFASKSGEEIVVWPAQSETKIPSILKLIAVSVKTNPLSQLIVVTDADSIEHNDSFHSLLQDKRNSAMRALQATPIVGTTDEFSLPDVPNGKVILWWAKDVAAPHIPAKQTLERLIVASYAAAFSDRFSSAHAFLSERPNKTDFEGKEHAMALMAGWHARRGSEDFYAAVWDEPAVARELTARLRDTGALRHFESIAE